MKLVDYLKANGWAPADKTSSVWAGPAGTLTIDPNESSMKLRRKLALLGIPSDVELTETPAPAPVAPKIAPASIAPKPAPKPAPPKAAPPAPTPKPVEAPAPKAPTPLPPVEEVITIEAAEPPLEPAPEPAPLPALPLEPEVPAKPKKDGAKKDGAKKASQKKGK